MTERSLLLLLMLALFSAVAIFGVLRRLHLRPWRLDLSGTYRSLDAGPSDLDQKTSMAFVDMTKKDQSRYDTLFSYFAHGFIENIGADQASVHYAGYPSIHGYDVTGLEGFARTAPLLGAYVMAGRPRIFSDPVTGKKVDMIDLLRKALLTGTNPQSVGYWGKMRANDQRMVEAADIARLLWLTRKEIWFTLSDSEKAQIAAWLEQIHNARMDNRNNWILFPVVIDAFLKNVGYRKTEDYPGYREFKENYLQDGWFLDGPKGKVDYYNAWGISYDLFWLRWMDPSFDASFIDQVLLDSALLTTHLVSEQGIPIMGRSVCYRAAIPSPVLAASLLFPSKIRPGLARRALDATWLYFIRRGVLRNGTMTMGYLESDPRLVDNYTGPGSSHWGLRSLTLAFMNAETSDFWQSPKEPLPIDRGNFILRLQKLGWEIQGDQKKGEIIITINDNSKEHVQVESYPKWQRAVEKWLNWPSRPENERLKYELKTYSSLYPFNGLLDEADH